ncbi:KAP family P-loop NTPase fold protein [Brochothrix thermosphacta]|uniref:KAP family P-loop NTPase fold protein n=1 Tax=Brochothrix thermosphacta TaxID=2756 RepID=UPI00048F698A|nr:P-loop NTPase fold protein [Brochothrix thermosphacta]ODJ48976.1 hypothetical protein BFR34_08930 [Brochothrix thermosphacta DSM 20171 = FSL F6-1036]ODJ55603.1 hypothetical protein BFR38_07930 [Brochothrix thermosphacta]ODJ61470.1 hypothetical protein BFR42_08360 [Brochothrix thermosphacta]
MTEDELQALYTKRKEIKKEFDGILEDLFDDDEAKELHRVQNPDETEEYLSSLPENRLSDLKKQLHTIDNRLGTHHQKEFLDKHRISIEEEYTTHISEDYLDRSSLADSVAKLIGSNNSKNNMSVGIIGEWGSGKSTFLELIKKKMIANKFEGVSVDFNASKYDDQEQIWHSLLQSVSEKQLLLQPYFGKIRFILKSIKNKKKIKSTIVSISMPFVFIILLNWTIHILADANFKYNSLSLVTGFSSLIAGVISYDLIKKLYLDTLSYFKRKGEDILRSHKYPNYEKMLGLRANVRQELTTFKDVMVNKNKDSSLVIFVDELDRCSKDTIINFFSSIEAFIDIKGITFVFSINPFVVYPALDKISSLDSTNSMLNSDEPYYEDSSGKLFIEKYITNFITLPVSNDYKEFININLKQALKSDVIDNISNLITSIAHYQTMTPREVKKILDIILINSNYFNDFTTTQFASLVIMKRYFKDCMKLFNEVPENSNALIKDIASTYIKYSDTKIPFDVFSQFIAMIGSSSTYTVKSYSDKIDRILYYV